MQQISRFIRSLDKNKTIQIHGLHTKNYQQEVMCCNVNIQ